MQILTPRGQAVYAYAFRPQRAMQEGKEPQFSITLCFENERRLQKLKDAIEQVAVEKFGAKAKKMLQSGQLKSPLRNAEDEGNENELIAGRWFINARSTTKPGVVGEDGEEELTTQDEFYAGCDARADVWLYAFDKAGNKGVAAILNNIQKLADGERISGRRSASEAFKDDDDEDDVPVRKVAKKGAAPKKKFVEEEDEDADEEDDDEEEVVVRKPKATVKKKARRVL